MKNNKLVPGIVLVIIGTAILLSNYGYLQFHWWNLIRLWPVYLLIAGINLVIGHYRSPWTAVLRISIWVLGLGIMLLGNFGNRYGFWPHYTYNVSDDDDNSHDDDSDSTDDQENATVITGKSAFNEPYTAAIKVARLNMSGGGARLILADTTNQLFSAQTQDNNSRYKFSHEMDDSIYVVNFKMKDKNGFHFDSNKNSIAMRLNLNPEWEVNAEAGAAELNFDLSKFKIRKVKLDGGAASFKLKLGNPLAITDVEVSTGVSSVEVSIPQNAACSIKTDSGLSNNQFDGFSKSADNDYQTPGYSTAKNKIQIHISGGLSDFKVNRY